MKANVVENANSRAMSTQAIFWLAFDLALALLLLFTVSDAFIELGVSSYQWMFCYALLVMRILPVLPALLDGLVQNWVLFLFCLVCFASVLWSQSPNVSLKFSIQYLMTLLLGLWMGLRFGLRDIMHLLFWSSSALVLLSGLHFTTGVFPVEQLDSDGRVIGIFAHKSYLARQALICALASFALLLTARGRAKRATRSAAVIGIFLSFTLIFLSQSITNLLSLPLAMGFLAILMVHRLPRQFVLFAVIFCIVSVAVIPVTLAALGLDPVGALFDITGKDRTLTGRTIIWDIAFAQIANHPLLGVGFGAFWDAPQFAAQRFQILNAGATSPSLHNFVLEILVATGMIGLGAVGILLWSAIRQCYLLWRTKRSAPSAFSLTLILLLIMLSLNTPGLTGQHEIQFVLLTACAVSARREYRSHQNRMNILARSPGAQGHASALDQSV